MNWVPLKRKRENLRTDIAFMIGGPAVIAIALLRLGNNISYVPGDPRAEPSFDLGVIAVATVLGVFVFVVGLVRLVQGLRDRQQ